MWVWYTREQSRLVWGSAAIASGATLLGLNLTAGWHFTSIYLQYAWVILCVSLVLATVWRVRREPWWKGGRSEWASVVIAALLLGVASVHTVGKLSAWTPPDEPVDMAFPLRHGMSYVAAAGGTIAGNPHMMVLEDVARYEPWRGQAYALDVVALDELGRRANGLYPGDPESYVVFGMPLYAPCDGEVLFARDDLPDYDPPEQDVERKGGNFLVIRCTEQQSELDAIERDDTRAVLAHLEKGSIAVDVGDDVTTQTLIGRVGNSGKSTEPHLHFHVQQGKKSDNPMSGTPIPVSFRGIYPTQNDAVCGREDGSLRRFPCAPRPLDR